MNSNQMSILMLRETDVEGVMRRLSGNEQIFTFCMKSFLEDETIGRLNKSICEKDWDDAFTAAHALKGAAGNMGFVPLMHTVGELVVLIRTGRTEEIGDSLKRVNNSYLDIVEGIKEFLSISGEEINAEAVS